MNPAQLLSHFDRISDAPDAIPRLRRFILDLAVRGKLVEQDPRDEPASELLKLIKAEKVNRSRIKKQIDAAVLEDSDKPFSVPSGWLWLDFGLIHDLVRGVTYTKSDVAETHLAGYLPILRANNISDTLNFEDLVFVRKECIGPDQYLRRGDYLIALSSGSKNLVGKAAFVPADYNSGFGGFCGVIRLVSPSIERFVGVYLSSRLYRDAISAGSRGIGINNLKRETLNNVHFPLPPLAEQHRIVAKVDELMALCDRLESAQAERESRRDRLVASSLNRLNNGADAEAFEHHARFYFNHFPRLTMKREHIQQLRQTILNLAVGGKLVSQEPNDEPALQLLKAIEAKRTPMAGNGTSRRPQPILPMSARELPAAVPDGWEWVRLGDLLLGDTQNGYSKRPDDALDGIPILRISAGTARKDGIVAEEEHKLISGVSVAQQKQYELQPGDLLACRFNGNRSFVGRLSVYMGYLGLKPIYPDKLIRIRLHSQFVLPQLVRCFAESSLVRRDFENYCATTVGNWGISAANLKEVKFPIPPLAEQHRIVAKVDELMALCDKLEAQLTTTHTESRCLLEAVLHEAFGQSA